MPHTTGDLEWNPETQRWQPQGGLGIQPYVPQGAPVVASAQRPEPEIRAAMRAELVRQGLPIPGYLQDADAPGGQQTSETSAELGEAPTVVSLGGTRHLVEGGELEPAPNVGEYAVDRLAELEPNRTRDTEPPGAPEPSPPPRRRR
jgi:hypothetical protein